MPVCALSALICTRGARVQRHPAFPAPSQDFEGGVEAAPGQAVRGEGGVALPSPPVEGEGRRVSSEARYARGWGDLSARALSELRDLPPPPPRISFAATLPLQGRVRA